MKNDNPLEEARFKIEEADRALADAFVRRMQAVQTVAAYKAQNGLPIEDRAREADLLMRETQAIEDPALRPYYAQILQQLMDVSKEYQRACTASLRAGILSVHLPYAAYPVIVEPGALLKAASYFSLRRRVLLVTDSGIPQTYVAAVAAQCEDAHTVILPMGEKSKNADTYQNLMQTMLSAGFDRGDCVVALGGGMVSDIAGFAASTYMRGIDYYSIPTTLLAQVDASVGGKTAIDFGGVKNSVGAFKQPKGILIDPTVLQTLEARQFAAGMAEIIKMALTSDASLLEKIETFEPGADITPLILGALKIKIGIVEQDANETGLRRVLNFGHTLGHGMEAEQNGKLLHGECVALGMLPFVSENVKKRLLPLYEKYRLPTQFGGDCAVAMQAVMHDKKAKNGRIQTVWVENIGTYRFKDQTEAELQAALQTIREEKV